MIRPIILAVGLVGLAGSLTAAAPGLKDEQRVPAVEDRFHRLLLEGTEAGVSPVAFENRTQAFGGNDRSGHRG